MLQVCLVMRELLSSNVFFYSEMPNFVTFKSMKECKFNYQLSRSFGPCGQHGACGIHWSVLVQRQQVTLATEVYK